MLKELSARLAAAGVPAYSDGDRVAPTAPSAPAVAGEVGAAGSALPELAFALCAPPHRQLLARGALERLDEVARTEQLPQTDEVLQKLMTLALARTRTRTRTRTLPLPLPLTRCCRS